MQQNYPNNQQPFLPPQNNTQQPILTPPKAPEHDPDIEAPVQLPTTGPQIVQYMKKKPYTQFLSGVQLTYSLLQKKQDTFLLTHERFLMLKGIECISYARVFPHQQGLPFQSLDEVLKPKTTFNLSEVSKVEGTNEKLIIHFSGPKKTAWEFHCPSASCALEWRKKIEEAVSLHAEFAKSGCKTLEEFLDVRHTFAYQNKISGQNEINNLLGQDNKGNLTNNSLFDKNNQKQQQFGANLSGTGSFNGSNNTTGFNLQTPVKTNTGFSTQSPSKTGNLNFSLGNNSPSINIDNRGHTPPKFNTNDPFNTSPSKLGNSGFNLNTSSGSPSKSNNFNLNSNINTGGNFNINQSNQFSGNTQFGNNNNQFGNNTNNQFSGNNSNQFGSNINQSGTFSPTKGGNVNGANFQLNTNGQQVNQFGGNNQFGANNNTQFGGNNFNSNPQFSGNSNLGTSNSQFGVNMNVSTQGNSNFGFNNQSSPNKPTAIQFQGPQISKVQDFMTNNQSYQHNEPFLGKSMSKITVDEKDGLKLDLNKFRRNWIEELVGGEEQGELLIDFKNYVQKISSVIINELYIPQNQKIFPQFEQTKEHAAYIVDDILIEIYFFSQDNVDQTHERYQLALLEFKNFDYLLTVTKNEGILKVPFYVHFQYKGFLGIAKSRIADNNTPSKNRQCLNQINLRQFEQTSRVSSEALLNENKCRIVSYERKTALSKTTASNRKIYFVDRLLELLPLQRQMVNNPTLVLRPQFIQDDHFDGVVFKDRRKPIRPEQIAQVIDIKEKEILRILQNQEEYFTNSNELADLLHYSGLNIRNLGSLLQKTRLTWLKKILQSEILARCVENYFRCDLQSCVMVQTERISKKQKQEQIQRLRVISFLNLLFGVSESSNGLWSRINNYSKNHFGVYALQTNNRDFNIPYFIQALQTHLKIVFADSIHSRALFKSPNAVEKPDFVRFEFECYIYNLDFSNTFQQINQCLDEKTPQAFANLSDIITKTTSTKVPYLEILKKLPIYDRICQFLLDFTSPEQSKELYNRMQTTFLPSRYIFESKLAEIKWYLKQNKADQINNPLKFIFFFAQKWLGQIHPIFVQINRILAMYFCDHPSLQGNALKYANDSLEMHRKIYNGDTELMWKDYLLVGKAFFASKNMEEGMKNLIKAKQMVRLQNLKELESYSELTLLICRGLFGQRKYQQAFNLVKQLYNLIKNEKDEQSLFYIIESVGWMKQILELNREHEMYYQFLQNDFSNHLKSFSFFPELLKKAIRVITVPSLKNAMIRRSKNKARLMTLVEEIGKIAFSSQLSLTNYMFAKINNGSFPRNFFIQLREIDQIYEQIVNNQLFDRWREFYQSSNQATLDKLSSADNVNRGFQFLANVTAIFTTFGKPVLDDLHMMEK